METIDAGEKVAHRAPARSVTVVLNPAAGRGLGARRRAEIERLLAQECGASSWNVVETTGPGAARTMAREAAANGADVVAAAGGDGTLGEVANGLAGTGARLGLLPLGTGDDFARSVGLHGDLPGAVRALFGGKTRAIDLGRAGERYFINIAGCGFDAVVAERINRGVRFLRGRAAYLAAVAQTLCAFRPAHLRLTLDGEEHEMRAMLCAVANACSYGGGMLVAPEASLDDGLFDLCIVREVGRVEFLRALPRVFHGTHVTHPRVSMLRARQVRIESDPPLPVLADGEVIGHTPVEFVLAPRAIELYVSPGS